MRRRGEVFGVFFVGGAIVHWVFGRGLFDEVFVERMSGVEFSENVARQRGWLGSDKLAHEFTAPPWLDAPAGIVAFGNPHTRSIRHFVVASINRGAA